MCHTVKSIQSKLINNLVLYIPCVADVDDSIDAVADDPGEVNSCGFMSEIAWRRTRTWSGS